MPKNYLINDAIEYKQTPGKKFCLNPAFERNLPDGQNKKLLDVGCGDGFYFQMCHLKGYDYTGVDISPEMIDKAQKMNQRDKFLVGSCFKLSEQFQPNSFDVVISSMLFPEFDTIEKFSTTLKQINLVLKDDGLFLLGTAHPAFDMYMRKYFLNQENVETDFQSYFDSSKMFKVHSINMNITFEDHHWTLEDYINGLITSGFKITGIDECKVIDEAKGIDNSYQDRLKVPSYILFKATKNN